MEELRIKTAKYLSENNISQNILAKKLSETPSYLSQFLKAENFKYENRVAKKLKMFFDNNIEKKSLSELELPFLQTKDVISIFNLIRLAVEDRDMATLVGEAGTGKTRAIKEFAKRHPETILIEATINTNVRSLLNMICEKIGINLSKQIDKTIKDCANELKKLGKIIIIDEAEHLPYRALETVRSLYNFSSVPFILVGTKKLHINLTRGKRNLEYEQLSSRIGGDFKTCGLLDESNKDLKSVCSLFGIKDEKLINLIKLLARGNFRKTEKLLRRSYKIAEYNQCEISEEIIKEATKMLLLL